MFSKVKVARELLRERASEILDNYLDVIAKAKDAGDYETASKSLQWLIEHMPSEDDGVRVVDVSVDKKTQEVKQDTRPTIQIGINVGGVQQPKQLESPKPVVETIDAK